MKTQKERAEERRTEKLADIDRQVERGQLTIRQMTPEERERHPAPPPRPAGGRRRSRS